MSVTEAGILGILRNFGRLQKLRQKTSFFFFSKIQVCQVKKKYDRRSVCKIKRRRVTLKKKPMASFPLPPWRSNVNWSQFSAVSASPGFSELLCMSITAPPSSPAWSSRKITHSLIQQNCAFQPILLLLSSMLFLLLCYENLLLDPD